LYTAFPSTLVSKLELSPPLPVLLLLRFGGLSLLNTRALDMFNLKSGSELEYAVIVTVRSTFVFCSADATLNCDSEEYKYVLSHLIAVFQLLAFGHVCPE
jgi:hypothetical protein